MKTQLLLKISLTTTIVGLIALFFLSEKLEPKLISIAEIDERLFEEYVKISGEIVNVRKTTGLYILSVKDASGEINVVVFKGKEKFAFEKGMQAEIIGKVSEFRGNLQIEAVEVRGKGNVP